MERFEIIFYFSENMKPNDFSDARELVTGGAGFIGNALVWALNRHGHESF
jgi:nucleoside-diphosphate-sugar epimerase